MASMPSRGGIEFTPGVGGAAPTVISSIDAELEMLYLKDEQGQVWRAMNLTPGKKVTMSKTDDGQRNSFQGDFLNRMKPGATLSSVIRATGSANGTFVATVESDEGLAVETLGAIRWRPGAVWVSGKITTGGAR